MSVETDKLLEMRTGTGAEEGKSLETGAEVTWNKTETRKENETWKWLKFIGKINRKKDLKLLGTEHEHKFEQESRNGTKRNSNNKQAEQNL